MMNRKLFLGSAMVAIIAITGFAQTSTPAGTSLTSTSTYGLFRSPFDAAFDPNDLASGITFTGLSNSYLFGGLTNFPDIKVGTNGTVAVPFEGGFYQKAAMPWSIFGSVDLTTTAIGLFGGTATTGTGFTTATSGGVTTTYNYASQTTGNDYAFTQSMNLSASAQYLIGKIGNINVGFAPSFSYQNNEQALAMGTWAANNDTTTITNYYVSAAGPPPKTAVDYTDTKAVSEPDTLISATGKIPFYIALADKTGLYGNVYGTYTGTNLSSTTTESLSNPQTTAGSPTTIASDVYTTDTRTAIKAGGAATLVLPPLAGTHAGDRFEVGASGYYTINDAGNLDSHNITQAYAWTGGGAKPALTGGGAYTTNLTVRSGINAYNAALSAQHYWYFDVGSPVVLSFAPMFAVSLASTPPTTAINATTPYYPTKLTNVTKTDGNGDGLYNNAADTITTTTTTYSNNGDGSSIATKFNVTVPSAAQFKFASSPFSLLFGNESTVSYTLTNTQNVENRTTVDTLTTDGTGATTSHTVSTSYSAGTQAESTALWSFATQFQLGMNFAFDGGAALTMLVVMDPATNLSAQVQATFPLP